jgi:hypothetical protein
MSAPSKVGTDRCHSETLHSLDDKRQDWLVMDDDLSLLLGLKGSLSRVASSSQNIAGRCYPLYAEVSHDTLGCGLSGGQS